MMDVNWCDLPCDHDWENCEGEAVTCPDCVAENHEKLRAELAAEKAKTLRAITLGDEHRRAAETAQEELAAEREAKEEARRLAEQYRDCVTTQTRRTLPWEAKE